MLGEFRIGDIQVGKRHAPFLIAEMSGNHNQSLERSLEIVEAAAKSGAHAVKLQTYTADTMTLDHRGEDFIVSSVGEGAWEGKSLYKLYQEAHTPWEWHEPIMARAKELGLLCFSSPFDESAVEFLEALGVPAYKIASFENVDLPLIKRVASTGKPVIMSTGMATLRELSEAVEAVEAAGCERLVLLKCTSTYPAKPEEINLATLPHMADLFGVPVGLSDHTLGVGVAVAGVALGATVIEKHFTLSRGDGGVDSTFSMEPAEFRLLVGSTRMAWESVGEIHYGPTDRELSSRDYRRSLYVVQDMKKGEVFSSENLRSIRPGFGLPPKYLPELLGKQVRQDIQKGTALNWDLVLS